MQSFTESELSKSKKKKPIPSSSTPPPIKPISMAAAPSPSKTALTDQIATPDKPIQPPRSMINRGLACSGKKVPMGLQSPKRNPAHLPEKYERLVEFFYSMVSSIRLIRLKGLMSTFSSISTSIQHLTERRFTYGHLAQLKFIFQEVILIKKVLLRDEKTCCMRPELQVTLQIDAIENESKREGEGGYSILRKIFRARVEKFSKEHPEGDDIPEEALPYPFNQTDQDTPPIFARASNNSSSVNQSINSASQQQFTVSSHMPQSFQRRFSQKTSVPDAAKTHLMCLDENLHKDGSPVSSIQSPLKFIKISHEEDNKGLMIGDNSSLKETQAVEGTPAKLISTPVRLMTATPDLHTPKRYRPSLVYDTPQLKKTVKRSARTKLFSTPRKNEKIVDTRNETRSSQEDDDISFLPTAILQEIREKEKKAQEEREAGILDAKRRKEMTASLPKLVDTILLTFQSGNRSIVTKQELIHKIISSNSSIADKGEVEEKLKVLEELVPDWLSRKVAFGDFIYRLDRSLCSQEIRRRLAEVD